MTVYEPAEDSELLKKYVEKLAKGTVLDMGTGSGIQAIATSKKADKVLAVDINPDALKVAKANSKGLKITFKESDLFSNVKTKFDTIIFNPPYLPLDEREPIDSRFATTGGKHGYELLSKFFSQANDYLEEHGIILKE